MPANAKYQNLLSEDFINACRDYFYLMNRHFPERGVLKMVGDRYRLDGDQRTVLYRGISSHIKSEIRKSLLENAYEATFLNLTELLAPDQT